MIDYLLNLSILLAASLAVGMFSTYLNMKANYKALKLGTLYILWLSLILSVSVLVKMLVTFALAF